MGTSVFNGNKSNFAIDLRVTQFPIFLKTNFLTELKRRNVYKVAITYGATAWLLAQMAAVATSTYGAPDWVMKVLILVLAIGFPIAIIFAWAFEMSPQGLIRTESEQAEENPLEESKKRPWSSNLLIGGLVLALVAQFLYFKNKDRGLGSASSKIESLAVLPISNLSGTNEKDHLADGMTDAVIEHLGSIQDLRVISRTSVDRFKENKPALKEIGELLDVEGIIEGSMQWFEGQYKIALRLYDAATEELIWSESFDREASNVLILQKELALAIARQVEDSISDETQERLTTASVVNPEAYDLFALARQYRFRDTPIAWMKSSDLLDQAIEIDSSFADAYGLRSISMNLASGTVQAARRDSMAARAKQSAHYALKLDPNQPDAFIGLSLHSFWNEHDWQTSLSALREGLSRNPSNSEIIRNLSITLCRVGMTKECLEYALKNRENDPLSIKTAGSLRLAYLMDGQLEKADDVTVLPENDRGLNASGRVLVALGRYEEAIAAMTEGGIPLDFPWALTYLYNAQALAGHTDATEENIRYSKEQLAKGNAQFSWVLAGIYSGLNDKEQTLFWLETALEKRALILAAIGGDPHLDFVRDEPRFKAILEKMRYPLGKNL